MDEQEKETAQDTPTPTSEPTVTADNTQLMSILAYVSVLILIPFLVAKDNQTVHYHIRQGVVLVVIEIALWIISEILWIPFLYPLFGLVHFGLLILSIIGIVNVLQKKQVELPLVGQYAKHFNI